MILYHYMPEDTVLPKIIPLINKRLDLQETLHLFFDAYDPTTLEQRVRELPIPTKFKKQLLPALRAQDRKTATTIFEQAYDANLHKLKKAKAHVTRLLNRCSNDMLNIANELYANLPWRKRKYYVLISAFRSFASWGGDTVGIDYKLAIEAPQIVFYELFITKTFEIADLLQIQAKDEQVWAIGELVAFYLVYRHKTSVRKCFSYLKDNTFKISDYYPVLTPIENQVLNFLNEYNGQLEKQQVIKLFEIARSI